MTLQGPPDDRLDEALEETFPASDPVANTVVTGIGVAIPTDAPVRHVQANGIDIAYRILGSENAQTVLLIPGVGGRMDEDGDALASALVARGYRVVTYDSRDSGASTHMDRAGMPDWGAITAALAAGAPPPVAYTLTDLATDAVALLNALQISRAHIVGGSLGGMVAQTIAADCPDRSLSLTSISSSSGNPGLPVGAATALVGSPVEDTDPSAQLEHQVKVARALESPAYRVDDATLRTRVAKHLAQPRPLDAVARQGAAAAAAGDRRSRLQRIRVPTVVIHGDADQLFPLDHGLDTASNIPGAALRVMPGMGHELPDALTSTVAEIIAGLAHRAAARQTSPASGDAGAR